MYVCYSSTLHAMVRRVCLLIVKYNTGGHFNPVNFYFLPVHRVGSWTMDHGFYVENLAEAGCRDAI